MNIELNTSRCYSINKLSVVIPIFNEYENIALLLEQLHEVLRSLPYEYEIIAVDDGSEDGSAELLDKLSVKQDELVVLHFSRNFGQTAAMMAGFDNATGDVVIPIDSDLQNDPKDIPKLIEKLKEGYDVVSGWRKDRQDHAVKRNLLSRIANKLISAVSGVQLHDYGCTLKAYKKSSMQGMKLYGEMHRFIPIYASLIGAKVTEVPVTHHKRIHGQSKYGMNRIFKVLLDLMVVRFLSKYLKKPIYFFGGIGFMFLITSFGSFGLAIYFKFFRDISLIETPLPIFTTMTFITGVMCILMGILAEMIMRTYFESQNKKSYNLRYEGDADKCDD